MTLRLFATLWLAQTHSTMVLFQCTKENIGEEYKDEKAWQIKSQKRKPLKPIRIEKTQGRREGLIMGESTYKRKGQRGGINQGKERENLMTRFTNLQSYIIA